MKEKRLLILGSVEDFTELTKDAKEEGIYTVVVDGAKNGEAKQFADKYYDVDIADVDLINQIIKFEKIDRILTSYSDNMFEYMVNYSEDNGLPVYCAKKKIRYLRDKMQMKDMFAELSIPTAKGKIINIQDVDIFNLEFEYPFVLKPLDGWGSKGIYVINNPDELKEKIKEYEDRPYRNNKVFIEEFNVGHEMNVMSWIKDGDLTFIEYSDREVYGADKTTIPHYNRIIHPSYFLDKTKEVVKEYLLKIANYVGITEGPLVMQVFYDDKNDKYSVGEVAGRFFGVEQYITRIISNHDINKLLLNLAYDPEKNKKEIKNFCNRQDYYSCIIYIKSKKGIVKNLGNIDQFINDKRVLRHKTYVYPGVATTNIPVLFCLYMKFKDRIEADEFTRRIYKEAYVPGLFDENLCVENELMEY